MRMREDPESGDSSHKYRLKFTLSSAAVKTKKTQYHHQNPKHLTQEGKKEPSILSSERLCSVALLRDHQPLSLSTVSEKSWQSGKIPDNWKKTNITPIFQKSEKEDSRNY